LVVSKICFDAKPLIFSIRAPNLYFFNLVFFNDFNIRVLEIHFDWKTFISFSVLLLNLLFFLNFDTKKLFEGLLKGDPPPHSLFMFFLL
jgi:hypothetical protein